jgi:WASH complex subunit strumpellin
MLLQLDLRFEGVTREMMVISYYRYKGASTISNIDDVCKLVRSTGFSTAADAKKPANYPIDYFARFTIMPEVLQMIIGRLRAEDIYNQSAAYPSYVFRCFLRFEIKSNQQFLIVSLLQT